jgi:hypothetical protein
MKKLFMGMGVATVFLAANAFGVTIEVVGACGSFANTAQNNSPLTGTISCPSAAALGIVGTVTGEFIVYDSDFSNPNLATETAVTNWAFSGGALSFATDTTTSTESGGTSTPATSTGGHAFTLASLDSFNNLIKAGFDDTVTSSFGAISVNYTNTSTVNTAVALTGYAQIVYTGSNLTVTTPEPVSMALLGSGLVALSCLRRRKSNSVR